MNHSNVEVNENVTSKLAELPSLQNIPFGKYYADYMLEANFKDGKWGDLIIKPYGPISFEPSMASLHYGQAIFEGMKAYKHLSDDKKVGIFCIEEHYQRFNRSAKRLQMPNIEHHIFVEGLKQLVAKNRQWVPAFEEHSLYLRPFMFATDEFLGVRASNTYKFMIICTPVSTYYGHPIKIIVQNEYSRAAKGGVGATKAAGNYAASLFPTSLAAKEGYDQVLWTDSKHNKIVEEVGTMNIFFVLKDKVITPSTKDGTILEGITRKSVIHLLKQRGIKIEERNITIDELVKAHQSDTLVEIFGTGTAVVINPVSKLKYNDYIIDLKYDKPELLISSSIKQDLSDMRYGKKPDTQHWMTWV